jgi:predicted permease
MNPIIVSMSEFIVMFLVIILIIQLLKRRGIFNDSHQQVFDRLVTEFALPAIIFGLLATTSLRAEWILPVLIVIGAVLVIILIAWGACRIFGISPATTGSIIILSAFGSTYTVGGPVLSAVFGSQSQEVALGQVIGTFGFALPFFTLGILIAAYFGLKEKGEHISVPLFLKSFLFSPIFLAFWLGLVASLLFSTFQLPGAAVFSEVFLDFFLVIRHSLDLLVWIAIGLLLRPVRLWTLLPPLAIVVVIHMLLLPAIVFTGGYAAGLPLMQQQVDVIMAAMPSGAIAGVIANRYGCNGKLASAIVICTYLISLITLPLLLMLTPGM